MEVLSPGTKNVQTNLVNRMLVYVYREFRANEKPDFLPSIRADDLAAQFPGLTDAIVRKRMKHCADLRVMSNLSHFYDLVLKYLYLFQLLQIFHFECFKDYLLFLIFFFAIMSILLIYFSINVRKYFVSQKGKNGMLVWVKRRDFRIPLEDELRRMLTPENVSSSTFNCSILSYYLCCYSVNQLLCCGTSNFLIV